MSFYTFLIVAAVLIPIFIGIDFVIKRMSKKNQEDEVNVDEHSLPDTFVYFLPFAALYYSEPFWLNLGMLAGVAVYGGLLLLIANRNNHLGGQIEMFVFRAMGSLIVTILGYYIFIHEGVLSDEAAVQEATTSSDSWLSYWPYAVYALVIIPLLSKPADENADATPKLIVAIIAFNTLPLFTDYFWWALLAGVIVFLSVSKVVIDRMDVTVKGGASFFLSYIYMMAAMASIIVYAVLF